MKDSTVIIIVVAGFALLFWAFSKGIIASGGVPIGRTGIVAPQPAQNYSGFLAASTAPGVAGALNGALSGIGGLFSGWLGRSNTPAPVQQGASASSPTLSAQPIGTQEAPISGSLVGPQITPISGLSYDAGTSGSAFDYAGLAADNAYDPAYSLEAASAIS